MFDKIRKAFGGSEKPKAETKQKIESAPEVEETAAPVAETKKEKYMNFPNDDTQSMHQRNSRNWKRR